MVSYSATASSTALAPGRPPRATSPDDGPKVGIDHAATATADHLTSPTGIYTIVPATDSRWPPLACGFAELAGLAVAFGLGPVMWLASGVDVLVAGRPSFATGSS